MSTSGTRSRLQSTASRASLRATVGETLSSGIRKNWNPAAFPADPEATRQLQEWIAEEGYSLFGIEHDFRGADLSGADFTKAWFTQAVLAGVRLRGATFYRADTARRCRHDQGFAARGRCVGGRLQRNADHGGLALRGRFAGG
ncbi:pentapeptide repeat-containing protein [Streptomyces cyaneofuscatus]|uniref:pentapeptide repeat-containing protein n=1 Tax=Streptomyces cyaneofuscatus TaxID=66883 RepID=UPI003442FECE